jgi:hypothetical protein
MKVTKWSINSGELHVSEQSQAQDAPKAEINAAAPDAGPVESAAIAPDHEAPKADAPKADAPKVEAPKIEANKASAPGTGGKMLIMAPGDRSWRAETGAKAEAGQIPAKRRFGAMVAVVALATIAGAVGGAFATMGMMHTADAVATAPTPASGALQAAIARIDTDVQQLKAGLDHTSRTTLAQFNKTTDRLDRIEKAQGEPNAKLAKLSEAIEKLRATPAPAPVVAAVAPAAPAPAAKDITGSVTPAAVAAAAPAAPAPAVASAAPAKPEVGRMPTVDGWYLTDIGYGGALIRNHRGTWEVYAGDRIPGLGRIDAIRKQDGRWVVVTEKGLIVARQ